MDKRYFIQKALIKPAVAAKPSMLLLIILSSFHVSAQRQRVYSNLIWVGHFSSIRLNNRFAINSDVQFRTKEWAGKWAQQLIRSGVSYELHPSLNVSLGGAWFRHAQYNGDTLSFRNEWRPWQEVAYNIKWNKLGVQQRIRLEQRFLQKMVSGQKTNQYDNVTRLRYRFEIQVPLQQNKKITASIVNEFMINPGYWGKETFVDQNRTFVGISKEITPSTRVQAQFMKIFLWRTNNLLEDQNVLRFTIHQQFNLRSKI